MYKRQHKPFTVAELFRDLNAEGIGQTSAVRSEVAAAETVEASSPDAPYDFSALTAFSGDDPEAAKSIMESFDSHLFHINTYFYKISWHYIINMSLPWSHIFSSYDIMPVSYTHLSCPDDYQRLDE